MTGHKVCLLPPFAFDKSVLLQELREELCGKNIYSGHIEKISYGEDENWELKVKFTGVELKDKARKEESRHFRHKESLLMIKLQESDTIALSPGSLNSTCILTKRLTHAKKADKMQFSIIEAKWDSMVELDEKFKCYASQLEAGIRDNFSPQPVKGRFVLQIDNYKILLELKGVVSKERSTSLKGDPIQDLWRMDRETKITFSVAPSAQVFLVDSFIPIAVDKVTVRKSVDENENRLERRFF